MPTYEFRCPDGHDFEKFYRSIGSAETEVACPVCGKIAERRISAAGFAFKGSGFYLTDYGKNAHRGDKPADNKSSASPASSSSKGEGGSSDGGSSSASSESSSSSSSSSSSDSASGTKSEGKAESKPAAAPKPSAGE